ncbi:MAG: SpoIIE family protein phosphatase [Deltaproteobacteria bacterium]|nr:SpoIIE family protein phosphatase [Deltaproteobacteria bacterium]
MNVGSAQRPKVGERVCGDAFVVLTSGSKTTIALADGLGHGPMAAEAGHAFCTFVAEHRDDALTDIIKGVHAQLRTTRGAVGAILRIDTESRAMQYVGVGNIDLVALSKAPIRPVSRPGVLGRRLGKVLKFDFILSEGDLLVFFSDGISSRFDAKRYRNLELDKMAEAILREHGKQYDDATCIVVKC